MLITCVFVIDKLYPTPSDTTKAPEGALFYFLNARASAIEKRPNQTDVAR
tara:strand:- start:416 stop:565 length:150 start_codon:yes stop_codon:yes gene_type:complete